MTETEPSPMSSIELEILRQLCERELEIIRGDNSHESAGKRMAYARVLSSIRRMQGRR